MSNVTYNNTPELKFWCQKALPLVYDDSLSYYEVLCKVVTYLNSTTEDVRNLIDEVNSIIIDLDNVAFINDNTVSEDYVWSSQKVVSTFPVINDTTMTGSSVWSSLHTASEVESRIGNHIKNSAGTSTGDTWSSNYINSRLNEKVDKVTGKGLSTNDYTNADKAIVDGVTSALADKVDKITGKGLSTNDYTDADKAIVDGVTTALAGKVNTSAIGANNGVASLGSDGKVPSSQLPSYVDDVLEYASVSAFPATGESGKIYVALDTNKTYRWSGTAYVEISESLALGETASTAYAGNKGKQNADNIATLQGYVPSGTSSSNKLVNATELSNGLGTKQNTLTFDNVPTENSNNPVKSGGVYSALGTKQNTLTFDNTPTENSNNPVKSGGVYSALGDKVSWGDENKLGVKNILKNSATSITSNNVTFTVNSDGSVKVSTTNGGASADTTLVLATTTFLRNTLEVGVNYILSGCPSGGADNKYFLSFTNNVDGSRKDTGSGITFTDYDRTTYTNVSVIIMVRSGQIIATPITFKPMIRLASILDDTYVPYAMTNKELTERALPITPTIEAETGVTVQTVNNIKFVNNTLVANINLKNTGSSAIPQSTTLATISGINVTHSNNIIALGCKKTDGTPKAFVFGHNSSNNTITISCFSQIAVDEAIAVNLTEVLA